jgi:hypothetical protein
VRSKQSINDYKRGDISLTGWKGSLVTGSGSGWGPSTESKAGIFAEKQSILDLWMMLDRCVRDKNRFSYLPG